MVEGGIYTILHNVISEISIYSKNHNIEVIAFVHQKKGFEYESVKLIEIPKSKKSWFIRLYYEYFYFNSISKKLNPDIWFSLHDTTPRVKAKKQFVYCHHPTTFFKPTWKDWKFDYKIGIFNLLYDFLFKINIKKNHTVFVQQHWIKTEFEKRFGITNCKVALPQYVEHKTEQKYPFEKDKIHFVYPSFPRSFKNHELICEAVKLLPKKISEKIQVHFTIKNTYSKYADYLITNYNNLDSIIFHPILKRKTLFSIYNSMDCLLFPSKLETWGLPLSEAKAYQKPILVANLPYAKETVGNYEYVSFFDSNNPNELAKLIEQFVNKTIQYQGNSFTFDESLVLHNWQEMFDYILMD